MAKIVKLNVYEKTVYAVQVEDNLYIDEIGVKHLSPSPENCKNTRNVPPALRTAFEHLAKNHAARKKVEDKRAINSYMWTGDKFSTWYSGVYEIAIEDDMTKEYAKDLAKKFAK